jgi:hypothetical protein
MPGIIMPQAVSQALCIFLMPVGRDLEGVQERRDQIFHGFWRRFLLRQFSYLVEDLFKIIFLGSNDFHRYHPAAPADHQPTTVGGRK